MNQKCFPATTKARKKDNSKKPEEMKIHLTYKKLDDRDGTFQIVLYISFDDKGALRDFYDGFPNGLKYVCMINGEEVTIDQVISGGFDYELKGIAFEDIKANTVEVKYCIK